MNMPAGKLTNGLIIANVVIYLVIWIFGWQQEAILRGGMFPIRLSGEALDLAAYGWLVPAWLTPLSSAFLHSGLLHIGFNMLMLLFCGRFVEQAMGAQLMALARQRSHGCRGGVLLERVCLTLILDQDS